MHNGILKLKYSLLGGLEQIERFYFGIFADVTILLNGDEVGVALSKRV